MIAARAASQAAEPAPRRSVLDILLLGGMDWTDANPWFGLVGIVLTIIAYGVVEQLL